MDAVELLMHDHRMVEQLFRDYDAAHSDLQRRGVVEVTVRELSKHAALEEVTVYPFAKRCLGDSVEVDRQLRDHMAVKRTLAELDRLKEGDQRERDLLERLQEEVAEHIREEEQSFLPRLRSSVEPEALEQLGRQLDHAKKLAPTRPHPAAPDEPPLLTLLAPLVAVYDRVRDRIHGRPAT
jgi:hemerythrin-like domain-containing protein